MEEEIISSKLALQSSLPNLPIHQTKIRRASYPAKETLTKTEEQEIEEEFEQMKKTINQKDNLISEASLHPDNYLKNRYPDVLPLEATRVRLKKEDDDENSDYINANYVSAKDSFKNRKMQQYICCQAPLPNTFGDFWRMIWEKKSPVIVMLTNLQERNRRKAEQYWPESKETQQYGNILVTHKFSKHHKGGAIIKRVFYLTHTKEPNELPHEVYQLHYTQWPDYGVPNTTDNMSDLITELDIRKKGLDDPIVVHCSAGIGRTGTFLAIHIALQKVATSKHAKFDVLKTVLQLREQRSGMVQSKDQYKFVYATIKNMIWDKYDTVVRDADENLPNNLRLLSGTRLERSYSQPQTFSKSVPYYTDFKHLKIDDSNLEKENFEKDRNKSTEDPRTESFSGWESDPGTDVNEDLWFSESDQDFE